MFVNPPLSNTAADPFTTKPAAPLLYHEDNNLWPPIIYSFGYNALVAFFHHGYGNKNFSLYRDKAYCAHFLRYLIVDEVTPNPSGISRSETSFIPALINAIW
jgi:hypothetical protein